MCLFKKTIVTPFNRLAVSGGQPLRMQVRCGHCAECKEDKVKEWKFRTHYEAISCIRSNGFVYYVTLTYANKHLPKLSDYIDITDTKIKDFSCFNHQHFKLFLKRLRSQLEYHNKGTIFRYFLTSEYGVDDRYTHRPHHHVLFFVYWPTLNALDFSRLVGECWQYGRTDGIPYKEPAEVLKNIFDTEDSKSIQRISGYISKYINKDSDFQKEIDKRISLLNKLNIEDEELQKLIRNINLFHRQSKGFGLYYLMTLSESDKRDIFETSSVRIEDKKKIVNTISLPLYYKRKLYYKTIKVDGKICWVPTEKGKQFLKHHQIKNISKTVSTLITKIANLNDAEKLRVNNLLGKRPLEELAIYNLYYKGYSRDLTQLTEYIKGHTYNNLTDTEYNLYDWLDNIIEAKFVNTQSSTYYSRDRENNKLTYPIDLFIDSDIPYYEKLQNITFNEHTFSHFRNFDYINSIIDSNEYYSGLEKQKAYEEEIKLKKRMKYLKSIQNEI